MQDTVMAEPNLAAAHSQQVERVRGFVAWVGDGRKLTQTGRITLADARALVELLDTGDKIDPMVAGQVFRTKSSEELRELTLVVHWATAARLVRVSSGKLVAVKKNARLLDRPLPLWMALFETYGKLGEAMLPSGWGESLLRREFTRASAAMSRALHRTNGPITLAELGDLTWATVTAPYDLGDTSEQHLRRWRTMSDRDVRLCMGVLARLGAVGLTEDSAQLTALGRYGMGRILGDPLPGEPIHQVLITMLEVDQPPVWRRLLIPASTRLDRFHQVIQAGMGWRDCHLHVFDDGQARYGPPDREPGLTDEHGVTVGDLAARRGRLGYTYDFGDDWCHEIVFEQVHAAEPTTRYPRCVDGVGACPPEDCGGPPGYEHLLEVLADPTHEEHEDMLAWLGLVNASQFDPSRFDLDQVNRDLAAIPAPKAR